VTNDGRLFQARAAATGKGKKVKRTTKPYAHTRASIAGTH